MKRGLPEERGNDQLWLQQVNIIFRQSSKCVREGTPIINDGRFHYENGHF